jgi:hypothetical protein
MSGCRRPVIGHSAPPPAGGGGIFVMRRALPLAVFRGRRRLSASSFSSPCKKRLRNFLYVAVAKLLMFTLTFTEFREKIDAMMFMSMLKVKLLAYSISGTNN